MDAEQRKQHIAGVFSRSAPTYDRVGPQFFTLFGRRLVELADLQPGAHVLDVAAGKGAVMFAAAERVGTHGSVIGVDFAEGMVEAGNAEIAQRGLSNVQMQRMDAENLEFADESFDAVLCGFAVFFLPNSRKALAEFKRVLKPGGRLALTTWGSDDQRWKFMEEVAKKVRPANMPTPPPPAPDAPVFNTFEGMRAFVESAGFSNINVVEEGVEFYYTDEEEWLNMQWSHGGRMWLEMMPSPIFEQWREENFAHIRALKGENGIPHTYYPLYTLATKP